VTDIFFSTASWKGGREEEKREDPIDATETVGGAVRLRTGEKRRIPDGFGALSSLRRDAERKKLKKKRGEDLMRRSTPLAISCGRERKEKEKTSAINMPSFSPGF